MGFSIVRVFDRIRGFFDRHLRREAGAEDEHLLELMGMPRKAAPGTGQPIPKQEERTEVIVVTTEDDELLLMVGNETIQIAGYSTESIGRGMTKINIAITGKTVITELSAISKG